MEYIEFGFFEGMHYSKNDHDNFNEYLNYHNTIPQKDIIEYIKKLEAGYACFYSTEIFTGQPMYELGVPAGIYVDGKYVFPTDFPYYMEKYGIGIPYDYEDYIRDKIQK